VAWPSSKICLCIQAQGGCSFSTRKPCCIWPLVWFSYAIPNKAFILWVTRVSNSVGVASGVTRVISCACSVGVAQKAKTAFFLSLVLALAFGRQVWNAAAWTHFPIFHWSDLICEGCKNWKSKSMSDVLFRLVLSSTVYNLWRLRNDIKHNMAIPKPKDYFWKRNDRYSYTFLKNLVLTRCVTISWDLLFWEACYNLWHIMLEPNSKKTNK